MPTRVTRRVLAGRLLRDWQRAGGQGTRSPGTQVAFPHAFTITPWMSWSASAGTTTARSQIIHVAGLGNLHNTPSPATNDYASWNVEMAAGTWSIKILYVTGSDQPILNWSLDGSTFATLDQYAGSSTYNNNLTTTGVVVGASGIHTIKALVTGKNASSSNYVYRITQISGVKTA